MTAIFAARSLQMMTMAIDILEKQVDLDGVNLLLRFHPDSHRI